MFADEIFQLDYQGIGLSIWEAGENQNITDKSGSEFTPYNGCGFTMMHEFNSEKSLRFRSGITAGFDGFGPTVLGAEGLAVKIADLGPCILDFSADFKFGFSLNVSNSLTPIIQTDAMVSIMKADRKGPYASIGLTNHLVDLSFPSFKSEDIYAMDYVGMIFAVGWRF